MTVGQITIHELLQDEQYKAYFDQVPTIPEHYNTPNYQPWRLLVQMKGETKWRSKRFDTYEQAHAALMRLLPKIHDGAINMPSLTFRPPFKTVRIKNKIDPKTKKPMLRSVVWKPSLAGLEQHYWCGYCRRPTIFGNKAMSPRMMNGYRLPATEVKLRCLTCGSNSELMEIRQPERNQGWDIGKRKFHAA